MEPATGLCYVLTFAAKHNVTLADMTAQEILPVVETWTRAYAQHLSPQNSLSRLRALENLPVSPYANFPSPSSQLRYMQIFENKGAAMGCSNPHPHCQIWTVSTMPEEPQSELRQMMKYLGENEGRHLLGDYAEVELDKKERVVWENEGFLVVVPWWAVWPFEVLVIPKRHVRALVDFTNDERLQFSEAIQEVTRRYDNLFQCSFPYSRFESLPRNSLYLGSAGANLFEPRLWHSPSPIGWNSRRDKRELLAHALLPPSPKVRDSEEVPGGLRNACGAAARYNT